LQVDEYIALRRRAASLFGTKVVFVPVGEVVAACMAQDDELLELMRAKSRSIAPLRVLLAHEGLRAHLRSMTEVLRVTFPSLPLVLTIPSPRSWIGSAYLAAFGEGPEAVDEDCIDSAAVYVAEFLRSFESAGLDAVVLEEQAGPPTLQPSTFELYAPIVNVARHYRWDLGAKADAHGTDPLGGPDFLIGGGSADGAPTGLVVPDELWRGADLPTSVDAAFVFATIPADTLLETVLERLVALRGQKGVAR